MITDREIEKEAHKVACKTQYCSGCRQNFYNGNDDKGIKECWSLKNAEVVERISIGHWEPPPYKNKKKFKTLSCWHGEGSDRNHYIDPDKDLDSKGFWKS